MLEEALLKFLLVKNLTIKIDINSYGNNKFKKIAFFIK